MSQVLSILHKYMFYNLQHPTILFTKAMSIIQNTSFMSANHKYSPSPENPFISTRGNSGYGNKLQRDDNNTNLVLDEIALGNIAFDEIIDNILTSRDE